MRKFLLKIAIVLFFANLSVSAQAATEEYEIDRNLNADHCEFYVNGFLDINGYYLFSWHHIKSFISVNEEDLVAKQNGKVLNVGMLANGKTIIMGKKFQPAYYLIETKLLPLENNGTGGYRPGPEFKLKTFAYFLDVQRADGNIDRLWLKNGDEDFRWPDVFDNHAKQTVDEEIGRGSAFALRNDVKDASPIFNQLKACK